ncbi:hypothetical protein N7509_009803 [Penicillium cosmopolitanum]|uniref:Uncharacterized protein n=1 Tax=Penicillium cosmopolitanum TaxID=1131564 RepID=A0A9X0B401_9EURO|nr:uncharacterized protein N7509_009803 [Penicillium cosmopolitanum]KAJ5387262.1 hypothetical protein N7509_009803 [Penicillium cosmopolitanum]
MPRPAPKRNRLTKPKATKANAPNPDQNETTAKSPPTEQRAPSVDPRQTPLAKNHDQAIGSSPTGDRPGTGSRPGTASRPPTRSRGYSSTMSVAGRKGETNANANSRIPGTPSFDTSMLSNFRRRPRQQSILQMVQAEDGSSELDDDDFLGGLSPQDESTPLNRPRRKSLLMKPDEQGEAPSGSQSPSPSPSASQSLPSSASAGSRKRKRAPKIEVQILVQVPQSSAPKASQIEDEEINQIDDTPSATPIPRNTYPEESQPEGETPQPPRFSDILSQTFLPPASSPASTATTAPRSPLVVPLVSGKRRPKDSAHMSTAALQNKLLPRRRLRRLRQRDAGEQHDESSDDSDNNSTHDAASGDDDELSRPSSSRRSRSQSRGASAPAKPKPLRNSRDKSKLNNPKQRKPRGKKAAAAADQEPTTTYSRSRREGGVDKENEFQLSRSGSPLSSAPDSDAESNTGAGNKTPRRFTSAELRAATLKFAEIDQWEMEFEDVSGSEI